MLFSNAWGVEAAVNVPNTFSSSPNPPKTHLMASTFDNAPSSLLFSPLPLTTQTYTPPVFPATTTRMTSPLPNTTTHLPPHPSPDDQQQWHPAGYSLATSRAPASSSVFVENASAELSLPVMADAISNPTATFLSSMPNFELQSASEAVDGYEIDGGLPDLKNAIVDRGDAVVNLFGYLISAVPGDKNSCDVVVVTQYGSLALQRLEVSWQRCLKLKLFVEELAQWTQVLHPRPSPPPFHPHSATDPGSSREEDGGDASICDSSLRPRGFSSPNNSSDRWKSLVQITTSGLARASRLLSARSLTTKTTTTESDPPSYHSFSLLQKNSAVASCDAISLTAPHHQQFLSPDVISRHPPLSDSHPNSHRHSLHRRDRSLSEGDVARTLLTSLVSSPQLHSQLEADDVRTTHSIPRHRP